MGKETSAALKYQRAMHLQADAVVGPRTLTAIADTTGCRCARAPGSPGLRRAIYVVQGGRLAHRDRAYARNVGRRCRIAEPPRRRSKPILIGQKLRVARRRARIARARSRSTSAAILDAWSAQLGVDQHLVRALAWMESGYQTTIVSPAGAVGVLQTLPTTREYVETVLNGRPIPRTVDGDVEVGVLYLKHLLAVFDGDESLALAGWYQGERAVREHGVYEVSKPFVANVLALRARM